MADSVFKGIADEEIRRALEEAAETGAFARSLGADGLRKFFMIALGDVRIASVTLATTGDRGRFLAVAAAAALVTTIETDAPEDGILHQGVAVGRIVGRLLTKRKPAPPAGYRRGDV